MTPAPTPWARPRLLRRMDESPLTVLWGPSGYGKTTLIEAWLSTRPDTPATRIGAPPPGTAPEAYWTGVRRAAADASASVLVLDLPDRIADPNAWSRLLALRAAHPRCRVVVAVRDHTFVADRRAAAAHAAIVTPAELEFTETEIADLLDRGGSPPSARTARDVWRRTAGHPALVAVADGVIRVFGSDLDFERERAYAALDAQVDDFVAHRLLAPGLSPGLREAARTVATVRRPTTGSVRALGIEDAAATVTALERAGLLRWMPPAPEPYWVYPAAVRRSLLRIAAAEGTPPARETSLRLARWLAENGDPVEALRHATDGEDWDLVVEVLTAHWIDIATTRLGVLTRALTSLPEPVVRSRAALYYARELVVRLEQGEHGSACPVPDVDPTLSDIAERDSVGLALATGALRSTLMRWTGDYDAAVRDHPVLVEFATRVADDLSGERRAMLGAVWMHLGLASQYRGDHLVAADLFERAADGRSRGSSDFAARQSAGQLALLNAVLGESRRAVGWLEREAVFEDRPGWLGAMIRLPAVTARLLLALDRLDLAAAEAARAALPELAGNVENWAFVVYAHSQFDLMCGRPAAGLDRLHRNRSEFGKWFGPAAFARPLLGSAAMDLHTAAGEGAAVLERAERVSGPMHPMIRLSAARAALLTGDTAIALRHTTVLARRSIYTRIRLEALLIQATASLESGDRDAAGVAWNRAVALSEDSGLLRPFVTVPADIRGALSGAGTAMPAGWAAAGWGDGPYPPPVPVVHLTEREATVLDGLLRGDNVARIAESQFVSPNTVKTQLKSLYRKLGVHSRADAVREARRRGLV